MIRCRNDEVENEIRFLQGASAYLQEALKLLNDLGHLTDKVSVCMRPEMYQIFNENQLLKLSNLYNPESIN